MLKCILARFVRDVKPISKSKLCKYVVCRVMQRFTEDNRPEDIQRSEVRDHHADGLREEAFSESQTKAFARCCIQVRVILTCKI